jgi:hypothetical protein
MENQRLERQGETGRAHSRSKVETLCWRALAGWLLELCWALLVEGLATGTALAQKIPALRLNAREICGQSLLALAKPASVFSAPTGLQATHPPCLTRASRGRAGRQAGR